MPRIENPMELGRAGIYAESVDPRWCMPPAAVETTAHRFLGRSLCCAVEVRSPRGIEGRAAWEPRLIVLRGGRARHVMEAIADTIRALPHHEVRIAAYDASRLTPVESPAPILCVRPAIAGPDAA